MMLTAPMANLVSETAFVTGRAIGLADEGELIARHAIPSSPAPLRKCAALLFAERTDP